MNHGGAYRPTAWLGCLILALTLEACGGSSSGSRQPAARHSQRPSERAGCRLCRPLTVGAHAAFVIGTLAVPAPRCPPRASCPAPEPKTIIGRSVRITRRADVELSGVLEATNPTRSEIDVVLDATTSSGRRQHQASVGGTSQETIATLKGKASDALSYQFVFPHVSAGSHQFNVQATATAPDMRVGSISLVIETLG